MRKRLITPPDDPLSLSEAKDALSVNYSDRDDEITALVGAAGARAELEAGMAFGEQTWEAIGEAFPDGDIEVPIGPLVSVTSITYVDSAGDEQVLDAAEYDIVEGHRIGLIRQVDAWPTTSTDPNAVVVRYIAGEGWPDDIKQAVRMMINSWFTVQQGVSASNLKEVPYGASSLIGLRRRMSA